MEQAQFPHPAPCGDRDGGADPAVRDELERRIAARTGGRVRDLRVEVWEGCVALRGRAGSYHVKQLAQEEAREALPGARLENGITVG